MLTDRYCDGAESKTLEPFDYPVYRRAFDIQLLLHRIDGFVQ